MRITLTTRNIENPCNLPVEDEAYMERTVETAIRALDNVIDLNFYPLEYALQKKNMRILQYTDSCSYRLVFQAVLSHDSKRRLLQ